MWNSELQTHEDEHFVRSIPNDRQIVHDLSQKLKEDLESLTEKY
jgi:hypothetical protein